MNKSNEIKENAQTTSLFLCPCCKRMLEIHSEGKVVNVKLEFEPKEKTGIPT